MMETPKHKHPRRKDDGIIIHFDYDCFYAQVIENQQPALKSLPLGIKQKSILATCNYMARRAGVTKLMGISDAKKICPELVLVDGEDLSPFRDVSKRMYGLLKSYSWNQRIERLGLDEYFMDVTDMVDYNVELLNQNVLDQSWFCLARDDPEKGFGYDAASVAGCVYKTPMAPGRDDGDYTQYLRLVVASHLARYIRMQIEEQGYTTAAGISTNKLLSKLVGNVNKPRDQTTLVAFRDEQVWGFMDSHALRKLPGIGGRTTSILESHLLPKCSTPDPDSQTPDQKLTVFLVRTNPTISPQQLEKLLSSPGTEKGLGDKTWSLLHGVDPSPVKPASLVPTQISIEDTYQGLNSMPEIISQLKLLTASLLRRMLLDLTSEDKKWIAHPKTIRLTTRPKTKDKPYNWNRASKSVPLPGWILGLLGRGQETVGDKLVEEILLPLFRRLNPGSGGWNVGLLNVCVANMVVVAESSGGRDIGSMFRRQEDLLKEWTAYDDEECDGDGNHAGETVGDDSDLSSLSDYLDDTELVVAEEGPDSEPEWEEDDRDGLEVCTRCGHSIPSFALTAHERFHDLEP